MLASDGVTPTSVTFSLSNHYFYNAAGNPANFAGTLFQDYAYDSSTNPNDIPAGQSPVQLTLNNLNPNREYDLYLFSQNGGFNNQTTHFTIGANTQALANSNVTGGPNSFVLNSNYALFSGLTPSASSQLRTGIGISGILR